MSTVTPLPCPFCGGKAIKISYSEELNYVSCVRDECKVGPYSMGNTKASAIARWNTRAPVADSAAQLLALADAMPDQPDLADRLRALAARERGVP